MNPSSSTVRRQSIQPTYDSRETGPRYHVTSWVNGRPIAFQESVDDPFVSHTLNISVLDILRGLLRRRLTVTVVVGADPQVIDDVLELDANNLVPGSTRQVEYREELHESIQQFIESAETE